MSPRLPTHGGRLAVQPIMREAARMLAIGFTSKQVAAHFKVSLSTLYRWVSRVNDARRDEERTP